MPRKSETFDFVCARAMGKHANLMRWSLGKLTPRGRLVLFLGESDAEHVGQMSGWNWGSPVRIPGSWRVDVLFSGTARDSSREVFAIVPRGTLLSFLVR